MSLFILGQGLDSCSSSLATSNDEKKQVKAKIYQLSGDNILFRWNVVGTR